MERTSSNGVFLPKRYFSFMAPITQASLNEKSMSITHHIPNISEDISFSDVLSQKIRLHKLSLDYLRDYQHGLRQILTEGTLQQDDYETEMKHLDESLLPVVEELHVLTKQSRTLELDVQQSYEDTVPKRQPVPSVESMERVYAATVAPSVMSKRRAWCFDNPSFRKDVIQYLNADADPKGFGRIWCHIIGGWVSTEYIQVAHLVPKCLRGEELTGLFGIGEVVLSDPRNGITLFYTISDALENGMIVIAPDMPSEHEGITKWRCILVDETKREGIYDCFANKVYRWGELDGKYLKFQSENRPARRFFYFRYVITYLNAKRDGNKSWVEKVDNMPWEAPGPWVDMPTLLSVGRNISGFELPPSVYEGNTFTASDRVANNDQEILLCASLRNTPTESSKPWDNLDFDSEEESENETWVFTSTGLSLACVINTLTGRVSRGQLPAEWNPSRCALIYSRCLTKVFSR